MIPTQHPLRSPGFTKSRQVQETAIDGRSLRRHDHYIFYSTAVGSQSREQLNGGWDLASNSDSWSIIVPVVGHIKPYGRMHACEYAWRGWMRWAWHSTNLCLTLQTEGLSLTLALGFQSASLTSPLESSPYCCHYKSMWPHAFSLMWVLSSSCPCSRVIFPMESSSQPFEDSLLIAVSSIKRRMVGQNQAHRGQKAFDE